MQVVELNKKIDGIDYKVKAEVEFDKNWIIKNLISVNNRLPKGQILKDRFSSEEIDQEVKRQNAKKCLDSEKNQMK